MSPKKFLIVGLGRIGDLVLMTPVFRAIKLDNPAHQVHLLASHINHQVVDPNPYLDKVYVESFQIIKNIKLIYALRRQRYDWWIDPKDHKSGTSRYYLKMANPGKSVGFNDGRFQKFSFGINSMQDNYGKHIATRYLQSLEPVGIEHHDLRPVLELAARNGQRLGDFCSGHHLKSYHLVNISSSLPPREWPIEKWAQFLNSIKDPVSGFLICCAPKDVEKARRLETLVENSHFYPTESIQDVTAAISKAEMILTVDTAIVHIAAAFNKPLLGLYINIHREYSKYYPLSEISKCVFVEEEDAFVDKIPVERVQTEYEELRGRMEEWVMG